MAKARIGHFAEVQVLEALGVDYIDESEVITPADEEHHIDKWAFQVPSVCGATNVGEALPRISEGAAMIRSKGEASTDNVVEFSTVTHEGASLSRSFGQPREWRGPFPRRWIPIRTRSSVHAPQFIEKGQMSVTVATTASVNTRVFVEHIEHSQCQQTKTTGYNL
jgi:hypothetical protein